MNIILLVVSIVCGLVAVCASFGWLGIDANYGGWLALAVVALAASFLPWSRYTR